ncbi:hypothetical protein B5S32_g4960 [[Candida] boidinii]|nr:hypothetical protein B5S32_g4960 [[Candida] boidinii]
MVKRTRDITSSETTEKNGSIKTENVKQENVERNSEESNGNDVNEDDDEDDEDDEDEESESEQDHDKKRVKKNVNLLAQDVQIARETAELFKSNIFKLQIDELIKELKLKESNMKLIEKILHKLYNLITDIPESKEFNLKECENYFNNISKNKIRIPFPDPKPTNPNYKFKYLPPDDISLIGSFGMKTGILKSNSKLTTVDISLKMPKSLIEKKDYLNYRILYKKSFYLAYLTDHLTNLTKKFNLPIEIYYDYLNDDILNPCLILKPINDIKNDLNFFKTKLSIRILIGYEIGIFDSKKLLPDRNCIRIQLPDETSTLTSKSATNDNQKELPPTPLYNASVLSSSTYDYYLKYLYTTKKSSEAFHDAVVLGSLWLKQRGFSGNINNGGFGHFEFAMLMASLLQGGGNNGSKILLHGFSSYQLFKGTIKYLATQDLCNDGYLSFSSLIDDNRNSIYKSNGFNIPTIFDKNTKINILWKMTTSSYELLKNLANNTHNLLNDLISDRFNSIFIQNQTNPIIKYDLLLYLPLNSFENEFKKFNSLNKISFLTFENFISRKIYKLLKKGLDERCDLINVNITNSFKINNTTTIDNSWSINKRKPLSNNTTNISTNQNMIMIGLLLNSSECEKKVTKGPLHSDKINGEIFKSFWGSKAQIRKYKDGNIQYSILWENDNENEKKDQSVVLTIIKFILNYHLSIEDLNKKLITNSNKFLNYLPISINQNLSNQPIISPSLFQSLKNSFDELCKELYKLNDLEDELPLKIKSISPISTSLRNTSLLLPNQFSISNPDFFNDLIIQFESSNNWPDELIALEKTKTIFLLKISKLLNNNTDNGNYNSFITKEDELIPFNNEIKSLNILTPDGFGFKLKILTERDEILYLRLIENSNNEKDKKLMTKIYLNFNKNYISSIKHHRIISLLVTHFPFYSSTVRLFKRWLESQLLLKHLPEEIIELIAIKVFIDPASYSVPSSVESGFIKILQFLSEWNWKDEPLILDLSKDDSSNNENNNSNVTSTTSYIDKITDKLTIEEYQEIKSNFVKLRKEDPTALRYQYFIASRYDPSGKLWVSSNEVSLPIATRLTALSKAAINLLSSINESNLSNNSKSVKLCFTPALKDYDFVLKLKTRDLTISSGLLEKGKFKNLVINDSNNLKSFPKDLTTYYDPIQEFIKEVNARFNNVMIVFGNKYTGLNHDGSNVLTGLLNPAISKTKKNFRVNIGYNVKPFDGDQIEFNKEAILNEIITLGGDLISSVEYK